MRDHQDTVSTSLFEDKTENESFKINDRSYHSNWEPTFEIRVHKFMLGKNENLNYDIKYDIKVNYNRIIDTYNIIK